MLGVANIFHQDLHAGSSELENGS